MTRRISIVLRDDGTVLAAYKSNTQKEWFAAYKVFEKLTRLGYFLNVPSGYTMKTGTVKQLTRYLMKG